MAAEPRPPSDDVHSGRVARGYARALVFLRFLVLPAWIAVAFFVYQHGPAIGELPTASVDALIPQGLAAQRAESESAKIFGSSLLPRIAVVQRNPDGLPLAQQRKIVAHAIRLDEGKLPHYPSGAIAAPYVNTLKVFPAARERSTTAITYLAFPSTVSITDQRDLAVRYAREVSVPGARAYVTGFIVGNLTQSQAIRDNLRWVEIATVCVIALIMGLYLRSLIAPIVTLISAALAWVLSTRAVAYLGVRTGLQLEGEIEPIVAVLLLGVVTDYSVFFLAGTRHRLLHGEKRKRAARSTVAQFIPIIATAGLLVAFGLTTLRVGSIGFVQSLGPSMAIVVIVSMVVTVTVVPSLIAILGPVLFWPGLRHSERTLGSRLRDFVTRILTKKAVAALAALLLIAGLLAAASGLLHTRLALTPIAALSSGSAPAHGASEAGKGFAPGIVSPSEVLIRGPGVTRDRARLLELSRLIAHVPGVAAAIGAGDVPVRQLRRQFVAPQANAVRYLLVFDDHPYGARAIDDLHRLQDAMPRLLRQVGLRDTRVGYAGDTAIAADTVKRIRHDIAWVALAAFAVNFVLLALFLRALVAPVLLMLSSALALAATFGVTTYFFQDLLGYGQLTYYVPLAVGVLLLSFGSDYNLFVVGRIWQESERLTVAAAIRRAAPRASRAISVAGLALALSFAALAIVPLQPFREFAFAMAAGILIDTFLVRTYLVPALIALFGRYSWWPSRRGGEPAAAPASRAVRRSS
ncbi:MAG TPA: MMPL family transporter [Gaiellaceae bacterium]|jgi:RND superfamily putative drug exporter|nr:MMPL family transporter [Gaiellaceae bacterium]